MQFNVSHLLKSPVGTTRDYEFDPGERLPLDAETMAIADGGHVRIDRTNTGILTRGHLDATVDLSCARCLDEAAATVGVDFAEEFEPSVDVTSGRPLPAPENDLTFTIDQNHQLDLGEALRQNVIAALPIQPLCRPDCAGLCPTCGANLNDGDGVCRCDRADEAPLAPGMTRPFAALAELLAQDGR